MSTRLARAIVLTFALAVFAFASPAAASTGSGDDCREKCVKYAKEKCDNKHGDEYKKCFWERYSECKKHKDCDEDDDDKDHGGKKDDDKDHGRDDDDDKDHGGKKDDDDKHHGRDDDDKKDHGDDD